MECILHPEAQAAGACTRCGKFFCRECLVEVTGKNHCRDCVSHAFNEHKQQAASAMPLIINNNNVASSSASASSSAEFLVAKNPLLAAIMAFFIPGLGHLYSGRMGRGIAFFIGTFLTLPIFIGIGVWIWNIIDAYGVARRFPRP